MTPTTMSSHSAWADTTGADRGLGAARALVLAVTAVVAVTWLPGLLGPLGDNHEGRIYGMVALQVSNLWELGWSASQWGTSRVPFAEAYSHHPPGFSLWYVPAWLLPGDATTWIRVLPYALGLAFLPASFALLHRLRVRPMAAAIAVGLVAATPLYWVYGRIWPALGLVALLAWAVVVLRDRRQHVSRARLAGLCVLAAFAVLANWFALAAGGLLGLWLLAERGVDRVTAAIGASMAAAAVAAVGWVVLAPDTVDAGQQLVVRTAGGSFTTVAFIERIGRWVGELLVWWPLVAVLGLAIALADRRTRAVSVGATVLGVGWVVGLPNGAWVHDYWIGSLLLPIVIGLAVLLDRLLARRAARTASLGVLAVLAAAAALVLGDAPDEYRDDAQAGELVTAVTPPDQDRGWVAQFIAEPTWLGYAWELPVTILRDRTDVLQVPDGDVVLVNLDRPPRWLQTPAALRADAVATEGDYVLVTGADLRAALEE